MNKLFSTILGLMLVGTIQMAAYAGPIDRTIFQSGINKSGIAISVKDINTGKTVYKLNDKQPKMPASTLKMITFSASEDTLGKDYEFSTKLYKSTNNDLYLKLGGDPLFTYKDLNGIFKTAAEKKILEPKNLYIDDYIFNDVEWGEGWQWDDDLNPLMPKFSSYNIDGNLLTIVITPAANGAPATIRTTKFYPVTFMNMVTTGDSNDIEISRNNSISPDIITVKGTVNRQQERKIPVNNPKRYFKLRLDDSIRKVKIDYYGKYQQKKTPVSNIYLVDEVSHPLSDMADEILKNSNNFIAETVFKAGGAKYVNNTGSLENSQKMLNAYLERLELNTDGIRIVDGSGVSKNNIVTADFMSEFLLKRAFDRDFVESLPIPREGTLTSRMLYFNENLHAKTGTLSDVSAIAGYITTLKGKTYAFDIMINDAKSKSSDKKSLEEYILRDIYTNY